MSEKLYKEVQVIDIPKEESLFPQRALAFSGKTLTERIFFPTKNSYSFEYALIFDGKLFDWYGRQINLDDAIKKVIAYFGKSEGIPYYIVELRDGYFSLAKLYCDQNYINQLREKARELYGYIGYDRYLDTELMYVLANPILKPTGASIFEDFIDFTTAKQPCLQKFCTMYYERGGLATYKVPTFLLFGVKKRQHKVQNSTRTVLVGGGFPTIEHEDSNPELFHNYPPSWFDNLDELHKSIREARYELYYRRISLEGSHHSECNFIGKPTFSEDGNKMTINCSLEVHNHKPRHVSRRISINADTANFFITNFYDCSLVSGPYQYWYLEPDSKE